MATDEIITFSDLLDLLEQHPEHRARLRQQILDEEFLQLPAQVRVLTETVQSHTVLLEGIVRTLESHTRMLESHARMLEDHGRTLESHGRMLESHGRTLESHGRMLRQHERHLSRLIGDEVERRFRRNAAGYFGRMMRRIRVIDNSALADLIDDAIDAGTFTEGDRRSLLDLDIALQGVGQETRQPMRLAVEVSSSIGERDIMRAADRAQLLEKLTGYTTQAVVAGYSISSMYRELAEDKGVAVTITAPPDAGEPEEANEPEAA